MQITIHHSNRIEILADRLADLLASSPLPPLVTETVAVPGKGMERWLSDRLAHRLGIAAGIDFPFPSSLIDTLTERLLPDIPRPDPYDPPILTWGLYPILADLPPTPAFSEPAAYLAGDDPELRRFQLARRIAGTFDRYTVYRPDILLRWERQRGEGGWQGELWRTVVGRFGETHRVHRLMRAAATIREGKESSPLPPRLSLFGIGHLPPLSLEFFLTLSCRLDLHLFLLSPCQEYWGDARRHGDVTQKGEEQGNDLLAAWGRIGRDFREMILDRAESFEIRDEDLYEPPGGDTLLGRLQHDILVGRITPSSPPGPDDRSVTVHLCHSPMREVEVLHDQLLHLFATIPDLTPRDVVVTTPDMESYAPCFEAVFGGEGRIPFGISYHEPPSHRPYGTFLARLMELYDGRFTPPEILDLLDSPPMSARFGFTPAEVERMRRWVGETGIVWGYDNRDRILEGVPPYGEGSWKAGLERLLWSWPLSPHDTLLYGEISPLEGIEGEGADLAGRFVTAVEELARFRRELESPRTLTGWRDLFTGFLSPFAPPEGERGDLDDILTALSLLPVAEETGGCRLPVPFPVVRGWISERLQRSGGRSPEGVATISPLRPMRGVPARVVALVGMNDGSFPRSDRPPGFDLTASDPRRGDCPLRDEDRFTMLESLLSARSHLLITCTGMSIVDDSAIPPSVVVSELLDAIGRRTGGTGGIVVRHPLHPFDPRRFMPESGLAGFSPLDRDAAESLTRPPEGIPPFVPSPLPQVTWNELPLSDLISFYRNPARFFLSRRLGFVVEKPEREFGDERLELGGLDAYRLRERILTLLRRGESDAGCHRIVRAEGLLPPGGVGDELFLHTLRELCSLLCRIEETTQGMEPISLEIDLATEAGRITGTIGDLFPDRILRAHPSYFRERHLLPAWLVLLVTLASDPARRRMATVVTLDRSVHLSPPDDPLPILTELITLFERGLQSPLPFFPDSSFELVMKGKLENPPDDPSFTLCFRGVDPLDDTFRQTADTILSPLLKAWRSP